MSNRFSRHQTTRVPARIMSFVSYLCLSALVLTAFTGASTAQESDGSDENALHTDAAMYAADWGTSEEEAVRRLSLQNEIGKLNATLAEEEHDTFAGLWIDNTSEKYRVVVQMTTPSAEEQILDRVRGTELEGLVEVSSAQFSLENLEAKQDETHRLAHHHNIDIESEINVQANKVQMYLPKKNRHNFRGLRVMSALNLPEGVVVSDVDGLSTPETNIPGGEHITTCTSGFAVKNSSGTRGITTAAHCNNSQSYKGRSLTFQAEDQQGNQDVQWHTAPDYTVTNEFSVGSSNRKVTATKSYSNQAVGDYVCKHGSITGYTCGNISSTTVKLSYVTNSASTFIRVHNNNNQDLSQPGDSGAPWFNGNTAYGTHSGAPTDNGNDAIYMPINYISSLGITVLTSP